MTSWTIPCGKSQEEHDEAKRRKDKVLPHVHQHYCRNGPDNIRPDYHVCEVCGGVFQQAMDFAEGMPA